MAHIHLQSKLRPCDNKSGTHTPAVQTQAMWQQEWYTYTCSPNSGHVTTSMAHIHLQSKLRPCDNKHGTHTPAVQTQAMWQQEWYTYTCSLNSSHVTTSLAYIHLQSKLKPCDNKPRKHTPAKTLSPRVTLTRPHTCSHPCWSSCPTPHPLGYPWRWFWCRRRPAASCRCCSSGCSTRAHNSLPASAQWGSSRAPELETNQFYMLFSCILLTALSFLTLLALIQTLCGWLGSKHQLTNCLSTLKLWSLSGEKRPQLTTDIWGKTHTTDSPPVP